MRSKTVWAREGFQDLALGPAPGGVFRCSRVGVSALQAVERLRLNLSDLGRMKVNSKVQLLPIACVGGVAVSCGSGSFRGQLRGG